MRKKVGDSHVVIGPPCWQPSDGASCKRWYFIISTCDQRKQFRSDMIMIDPTEWGEGQSGCEAARGSLILAPTSRPPLVIHDMGDEVATVRLCKVLWPGKRITKLRKIIEADYHARGKL